MPDLGTSVRPRGPIVAAAVGPFTCAHRGRCHRRVARPIANVALCTPLPLGAAHARAVGNQIGSIALLVMVPSPFPRGARQPFRYSTSQPVHSSPRVRVHAPEGVPEPPDCHGSEIRWLLHRFISGSSAGRDRGAGKLGIFSIHGIINSRWASISCTVWWRGGSARTAVFVTIERAAVAKHIFLAAFAIA